MALEWLSEQREQYTAASVELRDFPESGFNDLVAAMEPQVLPVRRVLSELHDPAIGRPLRLVVVGRLVEQAAMGPPVVHGPGALLGVEGLVEWNNRQELGPPLRGLGRAVHVLDTCWVLEIAASKFPALFGGADRAAARGFLLDLHARRALAPEVARALADTPELVDVRRDRLLELQAGAELIRLLAGESLAIADGKSPPDAAFVVVAGRVQVLVSPQDIEVDAVTPLRRGDVIGQTYLLTQRHIGGSLRALTDARLLRLPARRYQELMRGAADFRRAIARALGGDG